MDADSRRAARLLHVSAVGVLITAADGVALRPAAASHPSARALDALQAGVEAGPAYAALRGATACAAALDDDTRARWPLFARAMERSHFTSVGAVPVMLHGRLAGVLVLYDGDTIRLNPGSHRYALANLLATVLVTTAIREKAMRDLKRTIAELGALLDRVSRMTYGGEARAEPEPDRRLPVAL